MVNPTSIGVATASVQAGSRLPAVRTADSAPLGWRGVLVRAYREDDGSEEFTTDPTDDALLVLVLRGAYRMECEHGGGRWIHADYGPGSLSATAPHNSSRLRYRGVAGGPPESLQIHLGSQTLAAIAEDMPARAGLTIPDALLLEDEYVRAAAGALWPALRDAAPALHAEAVAYGIGTYLVLNGNRLSGGLPPRSHVPGRLSRAQLQRVESFMRERLGTDVTLDDLAVVAHTSKFHFARSYRATTGETPVGRLTALRMALAVDLLRATDLPVGMIARRCGYRSASGFSAAFVRNRGVRPTVFRHGAR